MTDVQYTQAAKKVWRDKGATRERLTDKQGRPAIKVESPQGVGLFTPSGKIIFFHPSSE